MTAFEPRIIMNVMTPLYTQVTLLFPPIVYATPFLSELDWAGVDSCKPATTLQTETLDRVVAVVLTKELMASPEHAAQVIAYVMVEEIHGSDVSDGVKNYMTRMLKRALASMPNSVDVDESRQHLDKMSYKLPGMTAEVEPPCMCTHIEKSLRGVIMHLNDFHRWGRERIADWLDELADRGEIDIDFPVPDELEKK